MKKAYKIYNEKMTAVNITETPKMVKFESRQPAFGYKKRESKNLVALTPQEAIKEKRNILLTRQGMLTDKLQGVKAELRSLDSLEEKYK